MVKEIELTQGKFATVDDDDFERMNAFKWFASEAPSGEFYACRQIRRTDGSQRPIWMHKVIAGINSADICDHIDGDSLNNTKANLRPATHQQNMCNRRMFKNNKSGFRGVCNRRGKWVAQITSHSKVIHIGHFKSPEEAARAYDVKAKELHGQFARLNFQEVA